jgi:putative transposase
MLRHGLAAGDLDADGEALAEAIEARLRTGRLLGAEEWIARQEAALARKLTPGKRGPKVKRLND